MNYRSEVTIAMEMEALVTSEFVLWRAYKSEWVIWVKQLLKGMRKNKVKSSHVKIYFHELLHCNFQYHGGWFDYIDVKDGLSLIYGFKIEFRGQYVSKHCFLLFFFLVGIPSLWRLAEIIFALFENALCHLLAGMKFICYWFRASANRVFRSFFPCLFSPFGVGNFDGNGIVVLMLAFFVYFLICWEYFIGLWITFFGL